MDKLEYNLNYESIVNQNMVVVANRDTGKWIKISKQCFDILNLAIENKWNRKELIKKLADDEDRKYFEQLLNKLIELRVVTEDGVDLLEIETVYLILTNRCNLQCKHCCVSAEGVKGIALQNEMDTKQYKQAIDKIILTYPDRIIISGGEPMIREDFMELLQYLRSKYNGIIGLATNGVLINESNVKELSKLVDRIDISIDGIDEITCSKVRGKGVFDKVLSSVGLLQENCFNEIYLSMVFGDFNHELKEKFKELNDKLGTHPLIREFVPIGRGKENAQIFSKEKENMVVDVNFSKDEILEARKNCTGIRCGAGITDLVVNYDGIVYPCANLMGEKYALFDIKVILDITDFWRNEYKKTIGFEALNNIQPNKYEKCKDCKINLFCWTCLQDIEMLNTDLIAFEKRCKLKKQILYPIIWE